MDGYLLDTNVASWACLESSSRHQEMRGRIAALGNAPVFLSAISIAESEYGMYAAQMDETTRQSIRNALAQFRMLDLDRHTAKQYGKDQGTAVSQIRAEEQPAKIRDQVL